MHLRENIALAPHTTIGLGGNARWFAECTTNEHIIECLEHARKHLLRTCIFAGGSNVVFPDHGFDGLVAHIATRGMTFTDDGDYVRVRCAAGEYWDTLVEECVRRGLGGIECLSGIPGSVGATPIQNVGAYGQEVADTIVMVEAMDRTSFSLVRFDNAGCEFGYRQSRFKGKDANRFVVTGVEFRLRRHALPVVRYPELQKQIEATVDLLTLDAGRDSLEAVRNAVLTLRRKKSMVVDPSDPNSRSVGSFFTNPVVSDKEFEVLAQRWRDKGGSSPIPVFPAGELVKVPAAWLVEQAGFKKGFRRGGVGVSTNHSLALVNYGGSSEELLALATLIQRAVFNVFGVKLEPEPVIVE
jgi:UDP-N-acetylmuramate dehydrogenase